MSDMKKNATAIGEKYPKLILAIEECRWCEIVWEHLYRGETFKDSCKKCGRCVACCGDEGACNE